MNWRRPGGAPRDQRTIAAPPPDEDGVVGRHLARAETDLLAITGGAPLCRIGDGSEVAAVKYVEGRHAAIRELRRQLRASPDTAADAAGRALLAAWEAEQRAGRARGGAWVAYRDGGVAELRSIVAELDASRDLPPPTEIARVAIGATEDVPR